VELAHAAWERGHNHVNVGTSAQLALTVARAHAHTRDHKKARRWLARGESMIENRPVGSQTVWWSAQQGAPETLIASNSAKMFTAMRDHARAEPFIARAAARWNSETHPRVRTLTLARLGANQAAQGHIEQACETWTPVESFRATRSARARQAETTMRRTLVTPRYRTVGPARELLALLNSWRT
jgi:hypothetical protein